MANTIDNRIVELQFDNRQFEAAVSQTISSMARLTDALKLEAATRGFGNVSAAANRVDLSGIATNVGMISSKFSVMGAIGASVIKDLTDNFFHLAGAMTNAIVGPLVQGGRQRALNIEQAQFQFAGLGMNVKETMKNATDAVTGTAYALDEAAGAAAMFGATGIKSGKQMTDALRGIAGVAAMSGSSYSAIADIFTKVAGQGRLMGEDLNRMASYNVNAAAVLAKALHKPESVIREMVTKGKISFKMFSKAMDDAFGKHATEANKTYAGSLANLRTAFARIGALYYAHELEALRQVFNALGPAVDAVKDGLKPFINQLGIGMEKTGAGLALFIKNLDGLSIERSIGHTMRGLINIFSAFHAIIAPIGDALKGLFPRITTKNVESATAAFEEMTKKLTPSKDLIAGITTVVQGLVSVLKFAKLGFDVAYGAVSAFISGLFGAKGQASDFSGAILDGVKSFSSYVMGLVNAAKNNKKFTETVEKVKKVMWDVGSAIGAFVKGVVSFARGVSSAMDSSFKSMKEKGKSVLDFFTALPDQIKTAFSSAGDVTGGLGKRITDALTKVNWNRVIVILFSALTTLGIVKFAQFVLGLVKTADKFKNKMLGVIDELTGVLKSLQMAIKAKAIRDIAVAVGILVGSLFVLSRIDPGKMKNGLDTLSLLVGQVAAIMVLFNRLGNKDYSGVLKSAFAIDLIAGALLLLSLSVKILGNMDPKTLAIGMGAVTAGLALMVGAVKLIPKDMNGKALGILAVSGSLLIMAVALKIIAGIDSEGLVRAIYTTGAVLGALSIFLNTMKSRRSTAAAEGMLLVSAGLIAIAVALKIIGSIPADALLNSTYAIGALLIGLGVFLATLRTRKTTEATQGMLLVSVGLLAIAVALKIIASIPADSLLNATYVIGALLIALGIFLTVLKGPETTAAATSMVIVSAALIGMGIALALLGSLSWDQIVKGLTAIAGVFLILGLASAALASFAPEILILSLALLVIATSIAVAGAGVILFALGIMYLAAALTTGGEVIIAFIQKLLAALPQMAIQLTVAIGAFLVGMIAILPLVFAFATALFVGLLGVMAAQTPLVINTMFTMLMALLTAIDTYLPQIINKASSITIGFLNGLARNMGGLVTAGANFIVSLLRGMGNKAKDISDAAFKTLIKFINGLTAAIHANGKAFTDAANAIIKEFAYQMGYAAGKVDLTKIGAKIVEGILVGIRSNYGSLPGPLKDLIDKAIGWLNKAAGAASPAKAFIPSGQYWVQGLIVGMRNASSGLNSVAKDTVTAAYSAMQVASDAANDVLLSINDPVITPVVDLDAVYKSAKDVAALMSSMPAIGLANSVGASLNAPIGQNGSNPTGIVTGGTKVEFTQNNYSPKALRPLEIYRQTNNGLRTLKRGLGVK